MTNDTTYNRTLPAVLDDAGADPGNGFNWLKPETGRGSAYTSEVAADILRRHSQGETIAAICDAPDMPSRSVWYWWLSRSKALARAHWHAQQAFAGALIDLALDAAGEAKDKDSAQAAKIKVDARLRVAAMIDPGKWSERRNDKVATQVIVNTNLGGEPDSRTRPGEYTVPLGAAREDK